MLLSTYFINFSSTFFLAFCHIVTQESADLMYRQQRCTNSLMAFNWSKLNMSINDLWRVVRNLGGVWFDCFLFSFSLKIKNGDENIFGWISENIFSENEKRKQPKNENNKLSFSVFSVESKNLISGKMKLWW